MLGFLLRFGGHSTSKTPDPFPNSAVKCRRANGTASQDAGEQVTAKPEKKLHYLPERSQ
jgi:hypothetical protein